MRTIGKKAREELKSSVKPLKQKESRKDRMLKAREAADLDRGLVTNFRKDNHKKLQVPYKRKVNSMGIEGRAVKDGSYDNIRYPHIAEVLCREYGFIASQLAEVFGVTRSAVEKWVFLHPDFKEAVRRGRDQFDSEVVERSLLKRATGYEYEERTERTVFLIGKKANSDVEVAVPAREIVKSYKVLPPDVKAIMFWLQNRNSDRWKSVSYIQAQMNQNKVVTHVNVDADFENMSVEQIKALREIVVTSQGGEERQELIQIGTDELEGIIDGARKNFFGNEDYEEGDL